MLWSDVTMWSPNALLESSYDLQDNRRQLLDAADKLSQALNGLASQGDAADEARAALTARISELDSHIGDVSELLMATADAADGVSQVRTRVADCFDTAAVDHLTIGQDGSVSWSIDLEDYARKGIDTSGITVYYEMRARKVADMIEDTLTLANRVDTDYAQRLQAVADGTYSSAASREGHGSFSQGLADLPQDDWSPTEVAAWWNALDSDERDQLIKNHPELIGNLDGVDAVSRDKANRSLLPGMVDTAQKEVDAAYDAMLKATDDYQLMERSREWNAAKERLKDLKAVETSLTSGRSLLVLDDSGLRLKAAIAIGNVDTAEHIATFVPGLGTTVGKSLDGYVREMDALRTLTGSQRYLAGESPTSSPSNIATIAWLGYDAPQDVDVITTGRAKDGADRLAPFLEGLQASHMASGHGDPHQTLLGHSYGSTTSGIAATKVPEGVIDDMVLFGSPGSGVQDVSEYRITPGHTYVSAVPDGDWVQGMGTDINFGRNPAKMDGFTHLSNDATAAEGYDDSVSWWQFWDAFKNHSSYLKDGTKTLEDFAQVVGGLK